jgi:hypothetical protein
MPSGNCYRSEAKAIIGMGRGWQREKVNVAFGVGACPTLPADQIAMEDYCAEQTDGKQQEYE